jgi:hypothetical protein
MELTHVANPVRVNAIQITSVYPTGANESGVLVKCGNGDEIRLTEVMLTRHWPAVGDYVVTQEDGYVYLNPKDVFERKYSAI